MIRVQKSSHAHQLLQLLSVAGEFPTASLHLLGNARSIKAMVHKLESVQEIVFENGASYHTRMFTVSGKRNARTVRLYKGALPILREIHPNSLGKYLDTYWDHKFPGDLSHLQRNHRVGEAVAMCMMAGIEVRSCVLPELQKKNIAHTILRIPSLYIARDLKKLDISDINKTAFTRIVGALFYPGGCYAVYNTREAVMKWSGMGELKTLHHLLELARMNAGLNSVSSAILMGNDYEVALQTVLESDKSRRMETRFDRIYQHVHFIPLDDNGQQLLRILTVPDWNEKLLNALFTSEQRPNGYGFMEFDAYTDGKYIYSHLDGDLARLIRLNQSLQTQTEPVEVLCFPWQLSFLHAYLGDHVKLKQIPMNTVLAVMQRCHEREG